MEPFFLDPANREFAEGKGPYRPKDFTRSASATSAIGKALMIGGLLVTLATAILYLYKYLQHEELLASVKTVTAQVSGCEGPGRYQHIRFRYTVDGKVFDQSAAAQKPEFLWPSTITDACKASSVELNYLSSDPNRWSAALISPLTWDERDAKPNADMFIAGPGIFVMGAIFAAVGVGFRKQVDRQDALAAGAVVLHGELLRMEEDKSEESPYPVVCYYQFQNPAGLSLKGKSTPYERNLKESDYPPAGTPIYVAYATDKIFTML
jgi:hypothetical protein